MLAPLPVAISVGSSAWVTLTAGDVGVDHGVPVGEITCCAGCGAQAGVVDQAIDLAEFGRQLRHLLHRAGRARRAWRYAPAPSPTARPSVLPDARCAAGEHQRPAASAKRRGGNQAGGGAGDAMFRPLSLKWLSCGDAAGQVTASSRGVLRQAKHGALMPAAMSRNRLILAPICPKSGPNDARPLDLPDRAIRCRQEACWTPPARLAGRGVRIARRVIARPKPSARRRIRCRRGIPSVSRRRAPLPSTGGPTVWRMAFRRDR